MREKMPNQLAQHINSPNKATERNLDEIAGQSMQSNPSMREKIRNKKQKAMQEVTESKKDAHTEQRMITESKVNSLKWLNYDINQLKQENEALEKQIEDEKLLDEKISLASREYTDLVDKRAKLKDELDTIRQRRFPRERPPERPSKTAEQSLKGEKVIKPIATI